MRQPSSSPIARRRPFGPSLLLCLALLWAQGFGLIHRIAHAPPPATVGSAGAPAGAAVAASDRHAGPDALTGHAPDDAECRLYDHATTADLIAAAPPASGAQAPAHEAPTAAGRAPVVAAVVHVLPRGPPLPA
jgi:hypothetical protein